MPLAIFERAMASCEGANFVWFVRWVFASQPKKNDSFFYVFAIFLDLFKVIFYFLPWKITIVNHHLGKYVWTLFPSMKNHSLEK